VQYGVRQAAETENYFTSVERINAYTTVEDEEEGAPSKTAPVIPDKDWPQVRDPPHFVRLEILIPSVSLTLLQYATHRSSLGFALRICYNADSLLLVPRQCDLWEVS
jgi:hypothetical protein